MAYHPGDCREGDLLLMTPGHGLLSLGGEVDAAIRWATVNPYDHAALVIRDRRGDLVIAEALLHVTISPLDKYIADGHRFWMPDLTPSEARIVSQTALSLAGQFYGWQMIMQSAVRDVGHIPWKPPLNHHHLDCSGFAVYCYGRANRIVTYEPAPSPASLAYSPSFSGDRLWPPPAFAG